MHKKNKRHMARKETLRRMLGENKSGVWLLQIPMQRESGSILLLRGEQSHRRGRKEELMVALYLPSGPVGKFGGSIGLLSNPRDNIGHLCQDQRLDGGVNPFQVKSTQDGKMSDNPNKEDGALLCLISKNL